MSFDKTPQGDSLHLNRRSLMGAAAFVTLFGSALIAPLARAVEAGLTGGFAPSRKILSPAQRAILEAASERIVPTTDTPGAIAAGVPDYIEMMLVDFFTAPERDNFIKGLDALAAHSSGFAKARPADQDAALTALMTGKVTAAPADFWPSLRQMVLTGYYTSETGVTVERSYLPVPGEYDGHYPYAKVGRIFAG
jgi:gluconate 2-dehydrogenase gamma chain